LKLADTVYFVDNEDIACLHDAKRSLKILEALNLSDKIKVVVNKDGISNIKVKDVANLLETAPVLVVPNDPKAARHGGKPRHSDDYLCPHSKATLAIVKLQNH
jgi:Flp pilus assembly CpaE family ATPase